MRSMFALRHTAQSLATYNDKQYACGWWGNKTPTSHLASGPETGGQKNILNKLAIRS